jgi:hypothetical protein
MIFEILILGLSNVMCSNVILFDLSLPTSRVNIGCTIEFPSPLKRILSRSQIRFQLKAQRTQCFVFVFAKLWTILKSFVIYSSQAVVSVLVTVLQWPLIQSRVTGIRATGCAEDTNPSIRNVLVGADIGHMIF